MSSNDSGSIDFLGVKLPTNIWAWAIVSSIGAVVVAFHYFSLDFAKKGAATQIDGGAYSYKVAESGSVMEVSRQKLIVFWTPNKYTKQDLASGEKIEPWYDVDDKEEKIKAFENMLVDKGVKGFNRFEVYGKGTTGPKRGYLWRITTEANEENFKREKFVKLYSEFWKRKKDIYVEEYNFSQNTR